MVFFLKEKYNILLLNNKKIKKNKKIIFISINKRNYLIFKNLKIILYAKINNNNFYLTFFFKSNIFIYYRGLFFLNNYNFFCLNKKKNIYIKNNDLILSFKKYNKYVYLIFNLKIIKKIFFFLKKKNISIIINNNYIFFKLFEQRNKIKIKINFKNFNQKKIYLNLIKLNFNNNLKYLKIFYFLKEKVIFKNYNFLNTYEILINTLNNI
ncbi:MAG: hypothetical protein ACH6QP_00030 [Candidatus Carsonella ruddii]